MDFTVDQTGFARALRLVGRVAPTRPTLPILQSILLEGEFGRLTLTATDVELGISTSLAARVDAPGRIAIPARLLADYVSQLPAEPLRLALEEARKRVRVSCGRFVANLAVSDPEEFPVFPPIDETHSLDLDANRLREAMERVVFAAARDDARPVLTAVLFDFGPNGLTLAAADGLRLARVRLPEVAAEARQLLVPARAVAEGARILPGADAVRLLLTPDNRGIYFSTKETRLFTRLVEGRYPDIERVIPRDWRTRVTVEAASLRQTVRVAGLFGGGDARPVLLTAAPGQLRLLARGDQTGDAKSELPATLEGETGAVALNTRLLADLLEAPRSSHLELNWTSPQAPVVVREVGQADSSDLAVIMPLFDPALLRQEAEAA